MTASLFYFITTKSGDVIESILEIFIALLTLTSLMLLIEVKIRRHYDTLDRYY